MKNLFVFLLLLMSHFATAQGTFTFPQTIVNGQTYNCKKSKYHTFVRNANNQFDNVNSNANSLLPCLHYLDSVEYRRRQIKEAFQEVFPENRVRVDFRNEGEVIIYFSIDKNGNVLEVVIVFSNELPITPQEIYLLETKMKNIKFVELGEEPRCKDVTTPINYIPIADAVRFKSLYP
jgi:hypothetical protein